MNGHAQECTCLACFQSLIDAMDAIATLAMTAQIHASWYGLDLRDQPHVCGQDQGRPVIPTTSWLQWFARDDLPRRALILAKVEVVLEAEQLLRS